MIDPDFERVEFEYNRDGFAILPAYLDSSELNILRDRAIPLARKLLHLEAGGGRFRNLLKSLQRHDIWFDTQLKEGRHVPLINHLMGGDAVGASAAWFDRPKGEISGIEPHVDAISESGSASAGATIWFALDPVDIGNGCVHYLKGSHTKNYSGGTWVAGVNKQAEDAFAAELNPGDAVIHSAYTVHWSGGNSSGRPRRAISYFYLSRSAYHLYQEKGKKK